MRFTQFILAALLLAVPAAQATPPRLTEPAPLKLAVPEGQKFTLGNGLTVILLEDHRIPVVRAYALVKAGSLYDSPDKIGTADMMADALRSAGTGNYPSAMFNEKLDFTGATINSGMESEYGNAEMFALAKDAPQTLAMFADMLINPAFEQEKVEILRNQFLESISRRNDNPQDIAYRESRRMFYGADNPYGWRAESGTISAVTVADLKNYHDNYYKPDGVILAVTGDFDTNNMLTTVKQLFGGWSGKAALPPTIAAPQTPQTRKVYYIERKVDNAPVVIYQDGPVRKDPDAYNFEVLNYIYGGSGLSSRLFSKVRTDLGLAYMVGSFTIKNNQKGAFETVTGTKNATVNAATTEILRQMKVISSEQVTDEELTRAQNGLVNSYVFEFTTPMEAVKERILRTYLGYPADFVEKYPDNIRAITKNSVLETAKKWLRPDNTMILVVGDESKLDKPLSALGEVIKRPAD